MRTWLSRFRNLLLALLIMFGGAAAVTVTGCQDDGPAEEVGEELDGAGEEIEEAAEEATDD